MSWVLIIAGVLFVGVAAYYMMTARSGEGSGYQGEIGPDTPYLVAKWRKKKYAAQTVAQIEANTAHRAVLEGSEIEDGFAKGIKLSDEAHLNSIVLLRQERQDVLIRGELTRQAAEHGMDLFTYLQVVSHRELKNIDLQAREVEYRQDQEQISRVQQEKLELVDRATHRLFSMYEQRKKLECSRDRGKEDKLAQLNYNIKIAEELIRGEQARYLEAQIGQTKAGSLSAGDESGRVESEEGTAEEPKRGPGRPRGSRNRPADK